MIVSYFYNVLFGQKFLIRGSGNYVCNLVVDSQNGNNYFFSFLNKAEQVKLLAF